MVKIKAKRPTSKLKPGDRVTHEGWLYRVLAVKGPVVVVKPIKPKRGAL